MKPASNAILRSIRPLFLLLAFFLPLTSTAQVPIVDMAVRVATSDATMVRLKWRLQPGAVEYRVSRDGVSLGTTVGKFGYFTDYDVSPAARYRYVVTALNSSGAAIARSAAASATVPSSATMRTQYRILAIALNPAGEGLAKETSFLRHRLQFLRLASLGSANLNLYKGRVLSAPVTPAVEPGTNHVDYRKFVTRRDLAGLDGHSIVDLVEQGAIDHVWVVKSPVDFGENALIGNRPIQGKGVMGPNSWVPIAVPSSRSFFVNAYLPDERAYDAYAHMVEGIMTSISDGYPALWPDSYEYTVYTSDRSSEVTVPVLMNLWEKFRLADGWNGSSPVAYASPGNSNMGSAHFPPTTPRTCADYCYYDLATWQRYVPSQAYDWLNYPALSGEKRMVNGYDFGAFNHYQEGESSYLAGMAYAPQLHHSFRIAPASFHEWWFAHIPHAAGLSKGRLNNWWPYLYDFNRFDGAPVNFSLTGYPLIPTSFPRANGEYGTDANDATLWGYWHSQNGFSPGAKYAALSMRSSPEVGGVRSGSRLLRVWVRNTQNLEQLGYGRNDVFYPVSRNAHWDLSAKNRVHVSVKPVRNIRLFTNTNPIIRLYRDAGSRLEFVPRRDGRYTNLFADTRLRRADGWYDFVLPISGSAAWEKHVIGYIDPELSSEQKLAAQRALVKDILSDVNYVEISIRSSTRQSDSPDDRIIYYVDNFRFD